MTVRIAFVGSAANVHLRDLAAAMAARSHEVHLCALRGTDMPEPPGVRVHDLARAGRVPRIRGMLTSRALSRLLAELRPDVVHAYGAGGAAWIASFAGARPLVVTAVGSDLLQLADRPRWRRWLTARALRRASCVGARTRQLAAAAVALGVDPARVVPLRLGVDLAVFHPGRAADREAPAIGDAPLILALRGLGDVYRPEVVALAFAELGRRFPTARFAVFASDAPESARVRFRERAALDPSRLTLLSRIDDRREVARWMQAAEVAISFPRTDGAGVSTLEAAACGAALVLADLPGQRERFTAGEHAVFVAGGDPVALAAAAASLLGDAAGRTLMARAAAAHVAANWNRAAFLADLERLHERAAASSR